MTNKRIVERIYLEGINEDRPEVFDELVDPAFEVHGGPAGATGPKGPEVLKRASLALNTGFPDLEFTFDDLLLADGDKVAGSWTMRGTHAGDYYGIPPSGRTVELHAQVVFKVSNGKVTDLWPLIDHSDLERQRVETSRATVRRLYEEALNLGKLDLLEDIIDPEFTMHDGLPIARPKGPAAFVQAYRLLHGAFPDLHFTLNNVVVEGGLAAVHWTLTGTHRGEFAGTPPTGRSVSFDSIVLVALADGKLTELWSLTGRPTLADQLSE